MAKVKFATKISKEILREVRAYAADSKLTISSIVDEALEAHLKTVRVRPAFRSAASQVLDQHAEVLKRLAK